MPRPPRIDVPGVTYHVVIRCNNAEWLLKPAEVKRDMLEALRQAVDRHALQLHAYTLMDNHIHLVLSRSEAHPLAGAMHWFMTRSARSVLRAHRRKGHVWQRRYRATIVQENEYALALLRYVDRNPLRAGLVTTPEEYEWTSCRAYATGSHVPGITLHPTYIGLSNTPGIRQRAYRTLLLGEAAGYEDRQGAFSSAPVLGSRLFCERFGLSPSEGSSTIAPLVEMARHVMARRRSPRQPAPPATVKPPAPARAEP